MRIAPLAFVVDLRTERQLVRDIVRITHANDEAYAGALAVLVAIQDREQRALPAFLAHVCDELPDSVTRDRLREMASLPEGTPIEGVAARLGSSGYVAETVPLALFAGHKMAAGPFEAGLEEIVKVAEDADTIASISGQVAGVRLGLSGLPNALLDTIPEHSLIEELGRAFARAVGEQLSDFSGSSPPSRQPVHDGLGVDGQFSERKRSAGCCRMARMTGTAVAAAAVSATNTIALAMDHPSCGETLNSTERTATPAMDAPMMPASVPVATMSRVRLATNIAV